MFCRFKALCCVYLSSHSDGSRQQGTGVRQIRSWYADHHLGVGVQRTGRQILADLGDLGLVAVHLPVAADAEFTRHVGVDENVL